MNGQAAASRCVIYRSWFWLRWPSPGPSVARARIAPRRRPPGSAGAGCADQTLTVGFIYVGPKDDYGYNQAHHEGALVIAKLPGVKIREEENVPETDAVQKTMESMISLDGAKLLFPTSFGYFDPHILVEAEEVPGRHVPPLRRPVRPRASTPPTSAATSATSTRPQYVSGIVAGHDDQDEQARVHRRQADSAGAPQHQRVHARRAIGQPEGDDRRHLHGRLVDARQGGRGRPTASSTRASTSLTMHVDSPKVIVEQAEKRGIFVTGYHASQAALAPKGYLTGAEWNWGKVYTHYVDGDEDREALRSVPHLLRGGFKEGFIKMSPYGAAVSDDGEGEGRRGQGQAHGRHAGHLQGPAQGQHRQA